MWQVNPGNDSFCSVASYGNAIQIWKLVFADRGLFADKLMKLAEEIVEKENEAQVCAIRIDCSDPKSVKEAFEAVNSLGSVEVLVRFIQFSLQLVLCHLASTSFSPFFFIFFSFFADVFFPNEISHMHCVFHKYQLNAYATYQLLD